MIPIKQLTPEIQSCAIKIGQITCSLNKFSVESLDHGNASSFTNPEMKDEKKLEKIVTDESNFCNLRAEIVNLSKSAFLVSKSVLLTPSDSVFISLTEFAFLTPDSIHFTRLDFVFTAVTPVANHLAPTSLYIDDLDNKLNESHLYNLFNQISQFVSVSVCKNLATQQSLGKELDLKKSFLMDSKKFLHYSDNPFHSPSFCNRSSIALLDAADDFVYAKSFPDLLILEEKVKEMGDDAAPSWKVREKDELMFSDLFSCVVKILFSAKPFSIMSPEPPLDLLLRRFQPHDPGDTSVRCRGSVSFGFQNLLAAHWLMSLQNCLCYLGPHMLYLGPNLVFGPLLNGLH